MHAVVMFGIPHKNAQLSTCASNMVLKAFSTLNFLREGSASGRTKLDHKMTRVRWLSSRSTINPIKKLELTLTPLLSLVKDTLIPQLLGERLSTPMAGVNGRHETVSDNYPSSRGEVERIGAG